MSCQMLEADAASSTAPAPRAWRPRRANGAHANRDRGATLVEFAMVMPLILALVLGIVEYGLLFKDWLTVSNASREGARVGSALGDDIDADCEIIKAVVAGLIAADLDDLQSVDIFESSSSGTPVPGNLNSYAFTGGAASDPLDCTNWAGPIGWPSATRNVTVGPSDDLDILGVRLQFTHNWVTNFGPFSGTSSVDETTIARLEPQAFE